MNRQPYSDEHVPEVGTYPAECTWQRVLGGGEWYYLIRDGDPKFYGAKRDLHD